MSGPVEAPLIGIDPYFHPLLQAMGKIINARVDSFLLAEQEFHACNRRVDSGQATGCARDAELAMAQMFEQQAANSLTRLKQFFEVMGVDADRMIEVLQ